MAALRRVEVPGAGMTGLVSDIAVGAAQRFATDTRAAPLSNTARRLAARLRGYVGKAIADYAMIGEGARGWFACPRQGLVHLSHAPDRCAQRRRRRLRAGGGNPPRRRRARLSRPRYCRVPHRTSRAIPLIEQDHLPGREAVIPGPHDVRLCSRLRSARCTAMPARTGSRVSRSYIIPRPRHSRTRV